MWEYRNGNYTVTIADDGTKVRPSGDLHPVWPESIDVKVTNRCDAGCAFCHEMSTEDGASFDPCEAYRLFEHMPSGVELAIGGGNPLECRRELEWMFDGLRGHILNVTVSAWHLHTWSERLHPTAIGVSYVPILHESIERFTETHANCVVHLIAGVHTIADLARCRESFERILVLGYKEVGRGVTYFDDVVRHSLVEWRRRIGEFMGERLLVFDNLAVQQLDVVRFFTPEHWAEMYMGDDGQFTMYFDLVKREFAESSRSDKRYSIGDLAVPEMFAMVRA